MAGPRKRITALRPAGNGRVAVDLDGARWRVVPLESAVRAGLVTGCELDRETARRLRRELRRLAARSAVLGALRYRDHSAASLRTHLERRGIASTEREEAVAAAERTGLIDDARFATGRAAVLSARGAGDLLIAHDLRQRGVGTAVVQAALAALEPEAQRAARIVAEHGLTAQTLRRLAAKGFSEEALSALVADVPDGAVG